MNYKQLISIHGLRESANESLEKNNTKLVIPKVKAKIIITND